MSIWWLSWATDAGFSGGCFVLANDFESAHMSAGLFGGRPEAGGQCVGCPVPLLPDGADFNVTYGAEDARRFMEAL